jgi:hypothetical protein
MTEYKLRQPLSRELEPLGLFVYILIITDLSVGLIERDERLLLGACFTATIPNNSLTLSYRRVISVT